MFVKNWLRIIVKDLIECLLPIHYYLYYIKLDKTTCQFFQINSIIEVNVYDF